MPFVVIGKSQACKASHVNIRGNIDKPASDQGQSPNPTPSIFSQMQILQSHPCFCILITNAHVSSSGKWCAETWCDRGISLVFELELLET